MALPTKQSDEFRPFIRRLPEFKFWYSATKATVIGFGCTFFQFFNIPVFWPILVMYFITLFCITMKRQIKVTRTEFAPKYFLLPVPSFIFSAHDPVPLHPLHLRQAQVCREGRARRRKCDSAPSELKLKLIGLKMLQRIGRGDCDI